MSEVETVPEDDVTEEVVTAPQTKTLLATRVKQFNNLAKAFLPGQLS